MNLWRATWRRVSGWTARPAVRWGTFSVYAALVLYACLADHPPVPQKITLIPYFDKVGHFCMYGGMMFLLEWAGALKRIRHPDLTFGSAAALFGFFVEVAQGMLTKHRTFDMGDEAANIAGILVFAIVYRLVVHRRRRKIRREASGKDSAAESRQRRRNRRRRLRGKAGQGERRPFH